MRSSCQRSMSLLLGVVVSLCLVDFAASHSWVRCTDYRVADPRSMPAGPDEPDPLRRQYSEDACMGYAASFPDGTAFGEDRGLENRPSPDQVCIQGSNEYTETRPMANYTAGSTVCLAYPAKNHVSAPCTSEFIPDTALKIYRSDAGASLDSFSSPEEFRSNEVDHLNGVHQSGVIDYLGFQNCPDFCGEGGTDRVLCTVCFEIEDDLSGMFHWAFDWEFNGGERYTTCWSAEVQAADSNGSPGAGGDASGRDGGAGGSSGGGLGTGASVGITLVVLLIVGIVATVMYTQWWKKRPAANPVDLTQTNSAV